MWFNTTKVLGACQAKKSMSIKQLRKRAGLKVEDVAATLDVAISTVGNWEQGRTIPRLRVDQTAKLLRLYNCTFEELEQAVKETSKVK